MEGHLSDNSDGAVNTYPGRRTDLGYEKPTIAQIEKVALYLLEENEYVTAPDVADWLEISRVWAWRILKRMNERGLLREHPSGFKNVNLSETRGGTRSD